MDRIVILGSADAIPDESHENTHLIFQTENRVVLVDVAGNPITRLKLAGLQINQITDFVITHFHPDHVAAAPMLLLDMWLLGRKNTLDIYGFDYTLNRFQQMMDLFGWENWPGFFPVRYHPIPEKEASMLISDANLRLTGSPVAHLIPTLGLRADFLQAHVSAAYSCDTAPCEAVIRLAKGADILFHEASGSEKGHSTPEQAAEIAAAAGVRHLYLIHYPPDRGKNWLDIARGKFTGTVDLAVDGMEIRWN
jgi:ribonuclease Z